MTIDPLVFALSYISVVTVVVAAVTFIKDRYGVMIDDDEINVS